MEYSVKTTLPLNSISVIYPFAGIPTTLSNWYNLSLIFTCTNEGESIGGLSTFLFFAINAKGGENIKPKAKGPHHQFQNFQNKALIDIFHWYLCHDNISIDILILRKQNLNWY
jgi:hypothetical protein